MSKGKIIVTATALILGLGVVAGFLGVEVVDGPENAVCFAPVSETQE